MLKFKSNSLTSEEISEYLQLELFGKSLEVTIPSSIERAGDNSFCYVDSLEGIDIFKSKVKRNIAITAICEPRHAEGLPDNATYVLSKNPKVAFYQLLSEFFTEELPHKISPSAFVGPQVTLGRNISVGNNCVLDGEIKIGYNSFIGNNVSIKGIVEIGSNCVINDGATIGGAGFEFIKDGMQSFHVPKIGKIVIGDNVWIGNSSSIERPTLAETVIKNHAKIDDLVHVGESSHIGESSQLTAGTVVAKDVNIGKNCFIGINCSIREGIKIADETTIGMGGVVVKNIENPGQIHAGVPCKQLVSKSVAYK